MGGGDLRISLGKGLDDRLTQVDVGPVELQIGQFLPEAVLHVTEDVLNALKRSDDGGTYVPLGVVGDVEDSLDVAVFHVLAHDLGFVTRGVIQEDGYIIIAWSLSGNSAYESANVLLLLELLTDLNDDGTGAHTGRSDDTAGFEALNRHLGDHRLLIWKGPGGVDGVGHLEVDLVQIPEPSVLRVGSDDFGAEVLGEGGQELRSVLAGIGPLLDDGLLAATEHLVGAADVMSAEAFTGVGSLISCGTVNEGQRGLGPETLAGDGGGESEGVVMGAAADNRVILPIKMGTDDGLHEQWVQVQVAGDACHTETGGICSGGVDVTVSKSENFGGKPLLVISGEVAELASRHKMERIWRHGRFGCSRGGVWWGSRLKLIISFARIIVPLHLDYLFCASKEKQKAFNGNLAIFSDLGVKIHRSIYDHSLNLFS